MLRQPWLAPCQAGVVRPRRAPAGRAILEAQILPEPLGLSAADRYLRGLRVLHPEDVIPAEPGDYLLDLIDVNQVRPMHTPENARVEPRLQFVERPEVRRSRQLTSYYVNRVVGK